MNSNFLVLSAAPYNFAGAGAAHARTLSILTELVGAVRFYSLAVPFRHDFLKSATVQSIVCVPKSDAYPDSDAIAYGFVVERMYNDAIKWLARDLDAHVVLLGTFLFPFCTAIESVARLLHEYGARVRCIVVPAGSDIWQVGRAIPHVTKQLLESPHITDLCTYSARFSKEITQWFGLGREIEVIPPCIDINEFKPLSNDEWRHSRQDLGIEEEAFVIGHCSNHRPVKGLGHLLSISIALSQRSEVTLLLVGPITDHLCSVFSEYGLEQPVAMAPQMHGALHVIVTGLRDNVRLLHGIADVSINTSLHDSFNISLAEAMACGVPVLTSDVAGVSELVLDFNCGFLVEFQSNSIEETSECAAILKKDTVERALEWLEKIRSDSTFRTLQGSRARQAVVERCSTVAVRAAWRNFLTPSTNKDHPI